MGSRKIRKTGSLRPAARRVGLPYLSIENVDRIVPALAMGEMMAEASTETNPSDVRIIATALHLDGIVEVRQVLIILMLAGALLSILAITNFILRHRY